MADETPDGGHVPPQGGVLYPWPKGVSGNPSGRNGSVPGVPRNMLARLFQERVEDEETAALLWSEYFRLCLHARSEELRSKMLQDLMDRFGVPRMAGEHGPTAVAQVVNIIRNSPDLGV